MPNKNVGPLSNEFVSSEKNEAPVVMNVYLVINLSSSRNELVPSETFDTCSN